MTFDEWTGRRFLETTALTGGAVTLGTVVGFGPILAYKAYANTPVVSGDAEITLSVNGADLPVTVEPRTTLLDAVRERLGLTGTKVGCNHGQCGACTVLIDGERALSCLTLALSAEGRQITTVEGLADGDALHPVQAAFVERDGFQCGYCTPGQICSAVAAVAEIRAGYPSAATADVRPNLATADLLTDEEIRERMSGNLCRCGAYNGIVAAVRGAAQA